MHSFVILLLALFAFSLSYGAVHQVIVGPDGDIVFEPDSLIIAVGDSVVFNKTNDGFHNIHEANNFFFCATSCAPTGSGQCSSGCAPTKTQWVQNIRFAKPGVYNYVCDAHAQFGMTGSVTVVSK